MSQPHLESESFSSVDAAWLHMDRPTNLAIITGVMTFAERIDYLRLRRTVERRFLIHTRFLQRIRPPSSSLGLPSWELDTEFDLDYHLRCITLPEPADHLALQDFVGELMSQPLDTNHPMWQFFFIEHYGHGSALVSRLHHCMADGLALVQLMLRTTDLTPDAPLPEPEVEEPEDDHHGLLYRLLRPAVKTVQTINDARHLTGNLMYEGWETLVHPSRMMSAARLGVSTTAALGKLLFIGPDRHTVLRGKCGKTKRAAWATDIDLEEVKSIGHLMGGTVNDVLLSAVTGALRRYIESRRQPTEGLNVRAIVPVNLRPPEDENLFGNRFGLIFLSLPVGIKDPLKRLITLRARMNDIKESPEAVVAMGILGALGLSPTQIEKLIVPIFGMKATAVMTNVPGPRQPLYFAGSRIETLMFWVPSSADIGLGVSIISYAGKVSLGIAADCNLVSDPQDLIDAFNDELQALKRWGRPPELPPGNGHSREPVPGFTGAPPVETAAYAAVPSAGHCQAATRRGQPCKNAVLPGSSYCRVHQSSAP
jgi:diacylglycerol O-acyltransferase / wax synthase